MTSNLACVGLDIPGQDSIDRLLGAVLATADDAGTGIDGITVRTWQDPSGARLIVSTRDGRVVDLLPSFAGTVGARFANCVPLDDDVATAEVVDGSGEQLTAMIVEIEQRRALPSVAPFAGPAAVVALGVDVSVFADADAYAASPSSRMGDEASGRRMAAEAFLSYGVFADTPPVEAYARISGTVLRAERRTTELTGQSFVVARVRTVGFEADLCFPAAAVPAAGAVITGTVFLVASLPELGLVAVPKAARTLPARRRWRRS
jgi:hypothetical protein